MPSQASNWRRGRTNWISNLQIWIPELNSVSLTIPALYGHAERLGIRIKEMPFRELHGVSVVHKGRPYIRINSHLTEADKTIALAHEFAHVLLHPPTRAPYLSSGSLWNIERAEREAQSVGVVALMPKHTLIGRNVWEIAEEFEVSWQVVQFRLNLFLSIGE